MNVFSYFSAFTVFNDEKNYRRCWLNAHFLYTIPNTKHLTQCRCNTDIFSFLTVIIRSCQLVRKGQWHRSCIKISVATSVKTVNKNVYEKNWKSRNVYYVNNHSWPTLYVRIFGTNALKSFFIWYKAPYSGTLILSPLNLKKTVSNVLIQTHKTTVTNQHWHFY